MQSEGYEGLGRPNSGTMSHRSQECTDHRLGILILSKPQSMQYWAGEPCQSVGEPLPDGTSIYVFHTAGIHNYVNTLP